MKMAVTLPPGLTIARSLRRFGPMKWTAISVAMEASLKKAEGTRFPEYTERDSQTAHPAIPAPDPDA
jgi:hypothetical protein